MKNIIDIKRILKGIVNALHALKLLIDDIPVPEPPAPPVTSEWIVPENYTSVSTSETSITIPEGASEMVLLGYSSSAGVTVAPVYVPLATLPTPFSDANCAFIRVGSSDVGLYIYGYDSEAGTIKLKTGAGTIRFYPYFR